MSSEILQYVIVGIVTFAASILGGISGYGTGLLLPPFLLPIVGAEALVPVIGISALLNNSSRLYVFREHAEWGKAMPLILFALPATAVGAFGYTLLSGRQILFLIGTMLIVLVPIRRILARRSFHLTQRGMPLAGITFGLLVGGTTGSGVVLLSILLSTGMTGLAVIATDAGITLVLVIMKSATFIAAGALTPHTILIGLFIGVCSIPGAFVAKKLAIQLRNEIHILLLDGVVILGGTLMIINAVR